MDKQLLENEIHEIPVTHYGVNEAKRLWIDFEPKTINELDASFEHLLELLLSYCNGEACDFQGDYRYYVHIPTQKVFKESGLGNTQGYPVVEGGGNPGDIRIARISELEIPEEELVS